MIGYMKWQFGWPDATWMESSMCGMQPTLLKLLRSDRRECAYLEFMVLVGHIYVSLQDVYCFICSLSPKLGGWSPSAIHAGRET